MVFVAMLLIALMLFNIYRVLGMIRLELQLSRNTNPKTEVGVALADKDPTPVMTAHPRRVIGFRDSSGKKWKFFKALDRNLEHTIPEEKRIYESDDE
jgi:hypothetical protein